MTGGFSPQPPAPGRFWWALALPGLMVLVLAMVLQGQPAEKDLFLALNHGATRLPAWLWSSLSTLGETGVLFALLSPLLWWRPQALLAMLAAAPFGGLMSVALKLWFDAPRPASLIDPDQFNVIGPLLHKASFPSGHTITAFAAAAAILVTLCLQRAPGHQLSAGPSQGTSTVPRMTPRWALWVVLLLMLGLAKAVGFSRIAVGAHWPVDVLAGAGAGWLAGVAGALVAERYAALCVNQRLQNFTAVALAALALWAFFKPAEYVLGRGVVWLALAAGLGSGLFAIWQVWKRYSVHRSH